MMGRISGRSDWEIDELIYLRDSGWSWKGIASFIGMSEDGARKLYMRAVKKRSCESAASSDEKGNHGGRE